MNRIDKYRLVQSRKIRYLQEQIDLIKQKYEKIDHGGCGTFSYYISEILDRSGIENQILYLEETHTPPGSFRCDIKFTHILVKTQYCYIDINGFYSLTETSSWLNSLKPLPKNKLGEMLQETRLWNNVFDEKKRKFLAQDLLQIYI